MPDLERIAELVTTHLGSIAVDPKRCSRIRSVKSECTACMEVCPVEGIVLAGERIELTGCLECGLCAARCPSEAIKIKEPTETRILERVQETAQTYGEALLCCRIKAQAQHFPQGVTVPCLGALSREFWLALGSIDGPVNLLATAELCGQCAVTGGFQALKVNLEAASRLEQDLVLPANHHLVAEGKKTRKQKKPAQAYDAGRRELFKNIFSGAKKLPAVALAEVLGTPVRREEKVLQKLPERVPGKRVLLKKALLSRAAAEVVLEGYLLPKAAGDCQFCNACSIICPTGALAQKERSDGGIDLELTPSACTGCGVCVSICYHQALSMTSAPALSLISGGETNLFQGRKQTCPECGQVFFTSGRQEKCLVCRNKQDLKQLLKF